VRHRPRDLQPRDDPSQLVNLKKIRKVRIFKALREPENLAIKHLELISSCAIIASPNPRPNTEALIYKLSYTYIKKSISREMHK
jgi:hypothetical protein